MWHLLTVFEIGEANNAKKSHVAAETTQKVVSSIDLKSSVVNKTL